MGVLTIENHMSTIINYKKMVWKKPLLLSGLVLSLLFSGIYLLTELDAAQTESGNYVGPTLSGRVVSQFGPVENARVRIAGDESYTLTDRQGHYTLKTAHVSADKVIVKAGKESWFNNGRMAYASGRAGDISINPLSRMASHHPGPSSAGGTPPGSQPWIYGR